MVSRMPARQLVFFQEVQKRHDRRVFRNLALNVSRAGGTSR